MIAPSEVYDALMTGSEEIFFLVGSSGCRLTPYGNQLGTCAPVRQVSGFETRDQLDRSNLSNDKGAVSKVYFVRTQARPE